LFRFKIKLNPIEDNSSFILPNYFKSSLMSHSSEWFIYFLNPCNVSCLSWVNWCVLLGSVSTKIKYK
jgi:hypothetical protein